MQSNCDKTNCNTNDTEYVYRATWTFILGPHLWGLYQPVFLLQKRDLKGISFEHHTSPSAPIFSDLKILRLHNLIQLKFLGFVYDCVNKTDPPYFHSFFALVESVHQYGARQASKTDIL